MGAKNTFIEKLASYVTTQEKLTADMLHDTSKMEVDALNAQRENLRFYQLIQKHKNKKALKKAKHDYNHYKEYKDYLDNKIQNLSDQQFAQPLEKVAKLKELDKAFDKKIERDIAKMIATSHEYKEPNIEAALSLVNNYKWEKTTAKINSLQGLDKPTDKSKVLDIAMSIKKSGKVNPFIVVNKLHGITPQTKGKRILLDGHHRMEACKLLGKKEVPVYRGTYNKGSEKPTKELADKDKKD